MFLFVLELKITYAELSKRGKTAFFRKLFLKLFEAAHLRMTLAERGLIMHGLAFKNIDCLTPRREYLPSPLMAFCRQNGRLLSANVENSRVFSLLLNLAVVDTGKSFRLFNPQTQEFLQAIFTGEE